MLFLDFSEFVSVSSMVALENVWLLEAMRVQGLLYLMTLRCWIGPINPSLLEIFLAYDILTQVNLTMSDNRTLLLTDEEFTEVTSSVTPFFEPTPRRRRTANTTKSSTAREQSHTSSDDGIVRLQVHPEQQSEGGLHRSGRVRTAIVYDP